MEVRGQIHAPGALPPEKEAPVHWIGGWVEPRGCLTMKSRETFLFLAGNRSPAVQHVVRHYTN
jgi:hypothetical protein